MSKKSKKKKESTPGGAREGAPNPLSLPAPRGLYQHAFAIAMLLMGLWVMYPELVFQNKVFLAGDVEAAASFATPIREAMKQGDAYPLWNPYLYAGMPSYESLSYTPYVYPVTLFTGFLARYLGFPNMTWLLFHIMLLGAGVYALLRHLGVHFIIGAFLGVLMMWMPNHVAVGAHGHGSQACAVAYMPLALLFWDRVWRGKGVVLNCSVLVIVLGLQFLRGHLQITYYTLALIGFHALFFGAHRIVDGFRGRIDGPPLFPKLYGREAAPGRVGLTDGLGSLVVLGLVVVAALMMSAVLFMPVQDFAQYSIRGASASGGLEYDYATSWSLHPTEALTFIVPSAFGYGKNTYFGHMPFTDYPNYVGIIAALFAVLAVFVSRDRFVRYLAVVVVLTTIVAFGRHLPVLYGPLFKFMPHFNKFRIPVMVLIVQQLAVVVLFGAGLSAMLKADTERWRRYALWGMVGASVALVLTLISYSYWGGGFAEGIAPKLRFVRTVQEQVQLAREAGANLFNDLVRVAMLLLATCALMLLMFKRVLGALPVVLAICTLSLFDFYMVDRGVVHPEGRFKNPGHKIIHDKATRDRFLQPDATIDFLKRDTGLYRVFPMSHPSRALDGEFRSNRYMNFGVASIGGYLPARLSIYDEFLNVLAPALQYGFGLLNMLNVRYVVSGAELPQSAVLRPVWQGNNYRGERQFVYENTQAFDRVFFTDRYDVLEAKDVLTQLQSSSSLDLDRRVLLEQVPAVEPQSAAGAVATVRSYRLNEIRIDAKLPSPAIMVLSEIYYPRWRVSVDGQPQELLKANYILRAVALDAGEHEVVFRYDTSLLVRALVISVVTFVAALFLLVGSVWFTWKGKSSWKPSS